MKWKISSFGILDKQTIDTSGFNFQVTDRNSKFSYHYVSLGTINSPLFATNMEMLLFKPFLPANYRAFSYVNPVFFFNTKRPYSYLALHSGPKKEVGIEFLHTQNVNKYFNFAINIDAFNSPGSYLNQDQREINFGFTSWYNRKAFQVSAFALSYTSKRQENGGITDPFYIEDTTLRPQQVNFKLQNAKSKYIAVNMGFNSTLGFIKRYTIDSSYSYLFSGFYNIDVADYTYRYTDYLPFYTNPIVNAEIKNLYYNKNIYSDTTDERRNHYKVTHYIGLRLNPYADFLLALGAYAAIRFEEEEFKNIVYNFKSREDKVGTQMIESGLFREGEHISLNFNLQYGLKGYRERELNCNLKTRAFIFADSLKNIESKIGFEKTRASYFNEIIISNHFSWNLLLPMQERFFASMNANLKRNLTFGLRYDQIKNYIYIDDSIPVQISSPVNVIAFKAKINFKFWQLHSFSSGLMQFSDESKILGIPLFGLYESFYHEYEWVKDVMTAQIGIDCYYSSLFYAPKYVPVLGQYVSQDKDKIGNYPLINVFFNAKIKNARLYIKLDHANYKMFGNKYYASPSYPFSGRSLRFGISWNFYN